MGVFLPRDLPGRILEFMNSKVDLPIVIRTELMACFYLFGKNQGVHGEIEILNVKNLARKTVTQIVNEVKRYANLNSTMNQELVRQNFLKRAMQIAVDVKDERKDFTDKADPIREHDCIWCMACVSVCPPQAVKVDQAALEFHEKADGTFNESLSKGSAPPPHAH